MLNSHTRIHAPHELHLNDLQVTIGTPYARKSITALGLDEAELANVLWDRMLHGALVASGKRLIVDKTPQNAAQWKRIHAAWPEARFIHLRRHPAEILRSRMEVDPASSRAHHLDLLLRYGDQLDAARAALPGPTVRYEDLATRPETTMRAICSYLQVRYEPSMLNYTVPTGNEQRAGLGDWSTALASGAIQAPRPATSTAPAELDDLTARWHYS